MRTHLAYVVTIKCPAPFPLKARAAINTPTRGRMLPCLLWIRKESQVPTRGRAIRPRFSGYRVAEGLVQQLSAAIALLGNVQSLGADVGDFGGGELHAATLESDALKGTGSRKAVGFRPAAPYFQRLTATPTNSTFQLRSKTKFGLPKCVSSYGAESQSRTALRTTHIQRSVFTTRGFVGSQEFRRPTLSATEVAL